ncbi:putative membrane-associated phospholipid phosphatase [Nonlabens ulvanivorans]|nr:phosphatase PAP2 family protein [Nonlabens ulvanivorans]GAK93194.1 putative membrane-associated phospholipid phosphatase [Nonlabens ulvanivorans]
MEDIKQLDWDIMLFLNDWGGNDAVDLIFNIITYKFYAIPLYLYLLYLLYKKLGKRELVIALITIAILVAVSDQIAMLFKNTLVQRLRPFREPALEGLISKVGKSGGTYGFYSGHASNAMALAVFMWHMLKRSHKITGILLFVWAILVAYSRVYLGVHYPGDVLMGMFMGTVIGWLCYRLFAFAKAKYAPASSTTSTL